MATDLNDMSRRLALLELAWPKPTEETEERCLQMLVKYDARDVAVMLGLVTA